MTINDVVNKQFNEPFDIEDDKGNFIISTYINSKGILLSTALSQPIAGDVVCNLINGVYKVSLSAYLTDIEINLIKPFRGRVKYLTRDDHDGSFVKMWTSEPQRMQAATGKVFYEHKKENYFGELPCYLLPSLKGGDMIRI